MTRQAAIKVVSASRTLSSAAMRCSTSASFAWAERFTRATSRWAVIASSSRTSFSEKPVPAHGG